MGQRVMVIDDDGLTYEYVRRLLTPHGYHLSHCTGLRDAVDAVREGAPHAAIVDLTVDLPDVGWLLVQALHRELPALRIILCSADHDALDAHNHAMYAMRGCTVRKPFAAAELIAALDMLVPHMCS